MEEKKTKTFLTDEIGDDYKNWMGNQIIFIDAPTGSGKTTFVLEKLIEHAAQAEKNILYLVNRTILKNYLEEKIAEKKRKLRREKKFSDNSLQNVIRVELYQTLEKKCKGNPEYLENKESEYDYIIADECHYFLVDSTFNTDTQLSYDWIMNKENATLVFMSATIKRIREWIWKNNGSMMKSEELSGAHAIVTKDGETGYNKDRTYKDYSVVSDYSYVEWEIIGQDEDLFNKIKKDNGKWLIFVDSRKKGEEMVKSLNDLEAEAVFIDAKSKKDGEQLEVVDNIVKEEKFVQKVVVATSVMDNGISIHDIEMRNMVIIADTKEEFIQMLGRKRHSKLEASGKLKLYILQRRKEDFKRRKNGVDKRIKVINAYRGKSGSLLEDIMKLENVYASARHAYYVDQGMLKLNSLAEEQCEYLCEHYEELIDNFEKDGINAFVREQIEWLGFNNAEEIIGEFMEKSTQKVCKIIDEYIDRDLDAGENEKLREAARLGLKELLESSDQRENEEVKKVIVDMGKKTSKDRRFSEERFNTIMGILGLEYHMEKDKGISRISKTATEES